MQVSQALHVQISQRAVHDESAIYCACYVAPVSKVLTTIVKVCESTTRDQLEMSLPYNLVPSTVIYTSESQADRAKGLMDKLGLEAVARFEKKGGFYLVAGYQVADAVSTTDPLSSTTVIGMTFKNGQQEASKIKVIVDKQLKEGLSFILSNYYGIMWRASFNGDQATLSRTAFNKDEDTMLKGELKSWPKYKFRGDGKLPASKVPILMIIPLVPDIHSEIQETQFKAQVNITEDNNIDFGGYFLTESIMNGQEAVLKNFLEYVWKRIQNDLPEAFFKLNGGDDLSSYCYGDHTNFEWTETKLFV